MSFIRNMRTQLKLSKELFLAYLKIMVGVWKIEKLAPPRITVFGGAKVATTSVYAQQANALAKLLVERGFSVITGGGPGIMEAANCGAYNKDAVKTHSIGIPVIGVNGEQINPCADTVITTSHFFIRKWLLTRSAIAFAVFPGGFGTMDEMFEILTLMQTDKLPRFPVVLIGVDYWRPLLVWAQQASSQGMITKHDLELLRVTDDINQACQWLSECAAGSCPV